MKILYNSNTQKQSSFRNFSVKGCLPGNECNRRGISFIRREGTMWNNSCAMRCYNPHVVCNQTDDALPVVVAIDIVILIEWLQDDLDYNTITMFTLVLGSCAWLSLYILSSCFHSPLFSLLHSSPCSLSFILTSSHFSTSCSPSRTLPSSPPSLPPSQTHLMMMMRYCGH